MFQLVRVVSWSGWSGGPGGPCGPCGPGGQGGQDYQPRLYGFRKYTVMVYGMDGLNHQIINKR